MKRNSWLIAMLTAVCSALCSWANGDYVRDVKPILAEKCYVCHGPAQQMGAVRLDTKAQRAAVTAGGLESEFVRRITSKDVSIRMPPWPAALSVSSQEIEALKSWAAEGATGDDPTGVDTLTSNLLESVDAGETGRVHALLKDRRLVNPRDIDGASILMHAVLNADFSCVKFLLGQGANPNVRNQEGATALIWASDNLAKVKLLLAAGAEVNAKTNHGGTALLAASFRFGSNGVVTELLRHGASVQATDHPLRADIIPISVGTDSSLALKTRKGTGLYKVPSLKRGAGWEWE